MIVYYNPNDFSITGISYVPDTTKSDPYIETEEPIAEDIFLRKEKAINFYVLLRDNENRIGFIKRKNQSAKAFSVSENFYLIPFKNNATEVKIKQDTDKKVITIDISKTAEEWWANEKNNHSTIVFYACRPFDLYQPLWYTTVEAKDMFSGMEIAYTGDDNFCIFTKKIFGSYSHECT